jgi:succinylglutamate desuccinylase
VVVAGIHGNEAAGIEASRRVLARLERGDIQLRGELLVLGGNVAALQKGIRYQSKDLNRVWTEEHVKELRKKRDLDPEDREQLDILANVEAAIGRARGRVHLADFHTSSAEGIPFILFGDTLPQRRFVRAFPIPVVIGLEEQVDGVLSAFWTKRNCVTFGCEGGQHDDPASVDALEAVLWIALRQAGLLRSDPRGEVLPELRAAEELLEKRRSGLPRVLEVVSRHEISAEDEFKMAPGFRNLDHAESGRLLAHDKNGEIRAPKDGMVILPLYQGLGSDGFFWGRAVTEARLVASELLRRLEAERFLPFLPGVSRCKDDSARLIVNTKVARIYPLDVFHLFGYRRIRERGSELTVERQPG